MCNFRVISNSISVITAALLQYLRSTQGGPRQQLGNHRPKGSDITVEKIQFCNTF